LPSLEIMSEAARRCIEALDARQQDISMLFLLAHTAWLERFEAGEKLVTWVREEAKLRLGEVTAKGFQEEVRREFSARGIRPVAPERCVHAMTKQGAKDLCLQAGWPCPFFPVMLQTRPKGAGGFDKKGRKEGPPGAFIVFSCWPDAFFALITMAGTGVYKGSAADIIFENQVADFGPKSIAFPCRIILDCDAKMAEFNNEYTLEELEQSIDAVPLWFVRELVRIKALKPTDKVVCYKKKKSRADKASAHFVFGIMGIPTEDIREVLDIIFVSRWKAWAEKQKSIPESSQPKRHKARGRELPEPWRVTDRSTMHGRNQFSTLLLKNPDKKETEFPYLERRMVIVNGEVTGRSRLPFAREEYEPGHAQALQLLHCCCYSSFPQEFVTLSPDFMIRKAVSFIP
jgi:hypothetical protein